jgi:hypothetical protein
MLDVETSDRVKAQAMKNGVSVSAMAAILITKALEDLEPRALGTEALEAKVRAIITLVEQKGLL